MKDINEAERDFLSGMVRHHEMAVTMAQELIPEAADPKVIEVAERIIAAQSGEIALFKTWLGAEGGDTGMARGRRS